MITTKSIGGIKEYSSVADTLDALWNNTGDKVKFVLSSNCDKWRFEIMHCIQFARLVDSLIVHREKLEEQYFFMTRNKAFYDYTTYCLSYARDKRLVTLFTGYTFVHPAFPKETLYEMEHIAHITGYMSIQLDSMLERIKRGLPSGYANSLISDCAKVARLD